MTRKTRSTNAKFSFCAIALGLAVSSCSSQTSIPKSPGFLPNSGNALAPMTIPAQGAAKPKTYGVGLSAQFSVSSESQSYSNQYCQDGGGPSGCPYTHPGLRHAQFAQSKTLGGSDGTFSFKQSGTSELGIGQYSETAKASSTDQSGGVEGAGGGENFQWLDTLHVRSQTLPKGSPVKISVVLEVKPSVTNVGCESDNLAQGTFTSLGSGFDSNGTYVSVTGGCYSGAFEYFTGTGQKGTSDKGTIDTTVGAAVGLQGQGAVTNAVCGSFGGTCVGNFVSALAGTLQWRITHITRGASYTTDSGNTYQ